MSFIITSNQLNYWRPDDRGAEGGNSLVSGACNPMNRPLEYAIAVVSLTLVCMRAWEGPADFGQFPTKHLFNDDDFGQPHDPNYLPYSHSWRQDDTPSMCGQSPGLITHAVVLGLGLLSLFLQSLE